MGLPMERTMKKYVAFYWESVLESLSQSWKILLAVFTATLLLIAVAYLLAEGAGVPVRNLFGDPVSVAKMPFYVGIFSNLGLLMWSASAAYCFMGSAMTRKDPRKARFLFVSGVFTAWLALDDMMLIHESVIPDFLHIGEGYVYLTYMILAVAYLVYFLKDILSTRRFVVLAAALFFFAASIGIDKLVEISNYEIFFEEGLKLFAITFWLAYFTTTSVSIAKECV
jgi:hypothetical protein